MVVLEQKEIPECQRYLPKNYNFEMRKVLRTIERIGARKVTLQFPDGLLKYSFVIIDIIEKYTSAECVILNDVVYGGCCVDDESIASDLLIHYGHSCLVPVGEMNTKVLYVFVDIRIDIDHAAEMIRRNFEGKIGVIGTIQYNSSINKLRRILNEEKNGVECILPQVRPLSSGEVLGCTSPRIEGVSAVISVGDGRFHLEGAMIRNPHLKFYKYCPFSRRMTQEFYDHGTMMRDRKSEISKAFNGRSFGVILGSLGRQGNKSILRSVTSRLKDYDLYLIMLDEISPKKLERYDFIDSFVQISCPRLSIDWGKSFKRPLLSPFEVFYQGGEYLMDYYSKEGKGEWKNYR
ncbi:diphthamide synthase subunit [Encephalitozoon hellem]|uniref:2-(3-amino-3-carboxypropyl)histidine synthase subunit 1 n=1 Tax=Encephalitozoon hellem TaxID=27973 RepID=A0A9Q9F8L1_ENCHE|nr:diphthamide synthase subunit DPH2 [Encephalitozoon hellem ATCC 50504]AFM98622.1 diphthamide synthase subunit DPH2 [Encephalitozoon hellem ATCC 50504]KAG5859183.1 diphthamide synthase subunit [Encephalitozoon hellem]UTX43568.1 2-(3-amino-3-carboxypropyl)histidine synthase [Encephalitozoon hellem]|eukprot:XP_003887603.1 diphthamide synthase subunit DPH2 [Encephalitozoon hellem ATCC 50504]